MKKLITIMAAAASALFAFGDVALPSGTSVEAYTGALRTDKDDAGTGSDSTYWLLQGDENADLLVTNYESGVTLPTRPAQFDGQANNNFLKIDTTGRLYRSIGVNDTNVENFPTNSIGDGLYLDTLVQFTAADDQFKADALASGDKIAISYVERDADSVDEGEDPYTNIVIRAGYIVDDNETIQTNYFAAVPAGFNKEDWHRLTVRAVASIAASGTQKAGFIVYLDGVALEYSTDVECGVGFAPAPAVAEYYKAACHAIYPSAVQSGDDRFTLSAVAFNGNGCVDDISFTDQTPGFIGRTVTFDLGTGDAVTTLTVAGVDYDVAGVATTNIENLVESFTIAVTLAANYNISVISNFEGCTYASTTPTSGTVTLTAASATVKVLTTRDNFDYIDENGDPQTAVTLTDALLNVGYGQTISLKFDYNVADWEDEMFDGYITGSDSYILDLNGHILNGGDDGNGKSLITVNGSLTIIDSQGNGGIIYDTQYGQGVPGIVASYGSDVYIGATAGDRGATFTGQLFELGADGYVVKGKFDVTYNSDGQDFLWEGCLEGATADLNQEETYWVVTPDSTITYAIEWTLTGGTTTASEGGFEENDTIEFTADSGKTLSFVSINGTEILDTSVYGDTSYTYTVGTADAVLVVTFTTPAPTTYEVTWTLTGGTTTATSGGDFEENDTIVFTAESGKTLSFVSIDGTEISDTSVYGASSYTYTVGTADAVLVVTFTGSSYPSYIDPTDTEETAKYTAWATYAEVSDVATGEVNEEAYLLNCKPSEVAAAKAAFKFTSISYDSTQSKWVTPTTTSYNNRDYNGEVVVKQYSDVGCTTESSTGTFFKAVLQ